MERWQATFEASRVVFGAGAIEQLGELAREAGLRRPLVVTDRGVRQAGHLDRALDVLHAAAVEPVVFDAVEPNPTTRHVEAGLAVARAQRIDGFVGLGGGSPLDCAKAINLLLTNGGRMEDYRGAGRVARPFLPALGVPTTAGTGSEAQSYALIAQADTRIKMACGDPQARFRGVILDPRLAATVPRAVAAVAGIDAVAHAVESHVSTRCNPLSQLLSREAWRLLEQGFPAVLADPTDLAGWSAMLSGAFFAGAAIEHSMLGAAHACANPLTRRFPIAHGAAVGLLLPHVIRFNAAQVRALYDDLARDGAPLEDRVRALQAAAGLAGSLRDHDVPRAVLPELAEEAERQWTARFNPRPVGRGELLALYEAAYA